MKSMYEQMGGTYTRVGDYFIPDLTLPDMKEYHLGKYGRMRRQFLKEHRPIVYSSMALDGTLFPHLAEIDETCYKRMEIIIKEMAKREGVNEALKASDQLEWVRQMNSIHNRAEEMVLSELVYNG